MKLSYRSLRYWSRNLGLTLLLLAVPIISHAQTVPHYLNFQTIVTDKDGNLIQEPFIDLEFQILDNAGSVVYYERQESVQVIRGVVNVTIGEGFVPNSSPRSPTGGISLTALHPDNRPYYLRMVIGTDPPKEDLELLSVPYSMWSERALSIVPNSIGSEEIKNSSIKIEDLEPGLSFSNISGTIAETQLPSTLAMDADITSHQTAAVPHSAGQISVRGPYLATDPTNVEDVLQALDRRIMRFYLNQNEFRENTQDALQTNIDTEETARATADTALQTEVDTEETARTTADTTLQANVDAEETARTTADTSLQAEIDTEETTRATADTTLTERLDNKKVISGSQDIFDGNSANVWVYQGRAGAPVRFFFIGGLFNQAHYSEMPSHTHTQSGHNHGAATGFFDVSHSHSGATDNQSASHLHSGITIGQSVNHTHGGSTGGQNTDHSHVGGTGGQSADHSHGGSTDSSGNHGHRTLVGEDNYGDDCGIDTYTECQGYLEIGIIEGAGDHSHSVSTAGASVDHSHGVSTAGASTDHSHGLGTGVESTSHTHDFTTPVVGLWHSHTLVGISPFSGDHSHSIDSVTPIINSTGTSTSVALSSSEKTYLNGMGVFIDGVDRTADLLALLGWGAFGDGTAGHELNDQTLANPGTGLLDVSSLFSSVGFHRIEFLQAGTAGGKISWVIQVD